MPSYESKARRAKLRLAGIGVVATAALTIGGTLAVTTLRSKNPSVGVDAKASPGVSAGSASSPSVGQRYTPATAARIPLLKASSNADGIGTGFEHSALGATSAAVSYWEDLDLLDDVIARRQWTSIAAKDSPETVDQGVSEVRKVREGVGLAPSGGTPDGLSFSTNVNAALTRSLDPSGDVVVVWMNYDRYASVKDKTDDDPLRDEVTNLVLKWESGDWKVTTDPTYTAKVTGPRAYDPNSTYAFMDGWREVADG
ncbi:hypothetical protein [Streptomyces sp. NPDC093223]|uniref:hypothetical protein n=1 Tax=Streptomyces sp. NPDC093223 TaxID=3366033 RepID=UPI0037F91BEE